MPPCGLLRIKTLRKKHVMAISRHPRSKPRHEQIDYKLYVTKKNERYVDFHQDRPGIETTC